MKKEFGRGIWCKLCGEKTGQVCKSKPTVLSSESSGSQPSLPTAWWSWTTHKWHPFPWSSIELRWPSPWITHPRNKGQHYKTLCWINMFFGELFGKGISSLRVQCFGFCSSRNVHDSIKCIFIKNNGSKIPPAFLLATKFFGLGDTTAQSSYPNLPKQET